MHATRISPTLALILAALALLLLSSTAWSQRVALIIGNGAYADRPLRNPVSDAQLMQSTLQDLGFQMQVATNVDRRDLLSALRDFEARARGAEVALFYYAGHGAQLGGANYLIPVNAPIRSETDVPDEAVDASSVLRRIEEGRARVCLVILDACRDNPYPGSARSSTRGLARMSAPTGSIVAYATAPGSTAEDGTGDNGTYTAVLARYLAMPGLDIKEVFDRTAQEVERVTSGKQRPREEIGLRGRFVLNDGGPGLTASAPPPASTAVGVSLADLEREQQSRQQWLSWQQRMQADFDRIAAFQGAPDLRVRAWQRFIEVWATNNPTSNDDERLRDQAQQQLRAAEIESPPRQHSANPPRAQDDFADRNAYQGAAGPRPGSDTSSPVERVPAASDSSQPMQRDGSTPSDRAAPPSGVVNVSPAVAPLPPLRLDELPASVQRSIPAIRIDGVVQSPSPASRLFLVNGQILRESETLVPGLRLERIGPDSAIFTWRGQLFQVPYGTLEHPAPSVREADVAVERDKAARREAQEREERAREAQGEGEGERAALEARDKAQREAAAKAESDARAAREKAALEAKVAREKAAAAKADGEQAAREKAAREREARQKAAADKAAAQKEAADKAARAAADRADRDRIEREKAEKAAADKAAADKAARDKRDAERLARERERLDREKQETERQQKEREERDRQDRLRLQREKEEQERLERQRAEREKAATALIPADQPKVEDAIRLARDREAARRVFSGNLASPGTGTGGTSSWGSETFAALPSDTYAGLLIAAIRPNIVFTERLAGNPAAEVEVTAGPDGRVIGRRLSKSSGRREWDEAVLRAVDRTRELPKDIDGRVPHKVVIVFRPND